MAQYNLGNCYELGNGVRQDYAEAYKWYLIAGDQFLDQARQKSKEMEKKIKPMMIEGVKKAAFYHGMSIKIKMREKARNAATSP